MTQKPVLLQIPSLLADLERELTDTYTVHRLPADDAQRQDFLAAHGGDFDGVVTSAPFGVDASLIEALPKMRVISSFGVGLDKLDLAAAARRGIAVGYTPDVLTDCVADLAFGLILAVGRQIPAGDRFVRAGCWSAPSAKPLPLGRRVSGARLGIVGFGRIGRAIARRSSGFGMEVRYHDLRPAEHMPWTYEPQLRALALWSDFFVVSVAGGAGTRHLIDAAVLASLGTEGYIINVSRGSVIDERALVDALTEGRIGGAALDVFEREPHVPSDLLRLGNVVLLPHLASATVQTREAMARRVLDNLAAFFAGTPLPSAAPIPSP